MGFWDTDSEGLDWYDLTPFGVYDNVSRLTDKHSQAMAPDGTNADGSLHYPTSDGLAPSNPPVRKPGLLDRAQTALSTVTGAGEKVTGNYAEILKYATYIAAIIGTIYVIAVFAPAVRR